MAVVSSKLFWRIATTRAFLNADTLRTRHFFTASKYASYLRRGLFVVSSVGRSVGGSALRPLRSRAYSMILDTTAASAVSRARLRFSCDCAASYLSPRPSFTFKRAFSSSLSGLFPLFLLSSCLFSALSFACAASGLGPVNFFVVPVGWMGGGWMERVSDELHLESLSFSPQRTFPSRPNVQSLGEPAGDGLRRRVPRRLLPGLRLDHREPTQLLLHVAVVRRVGPPLLELPEVLHLCEPLVPARAKSEQKEG